MIVDGILIGAHWWWLVAAIVLGIAEIAAPGFFLVWLAAAAALVGVLTYALALPVLAQAISFALAALAAVHVGRRWIAAHPAVSPDPLLNDRAGRLVGETVLVVEPILGGSGRVKVGDGVWNARGPDAELGARVRIVGAHGTTLDVEPV